MDYKIQELYAQIGSEGQKILSSKTVSVLGLGGVGTVVSDILARMGVNLRLVDKERVLEFDQPRQSVYQIEDISKFKAKQLKKRLEDITTKVKIKSFHEDVHKDNVFLLDADLIVDASNNEATVLLVNEYAVKNGIPLISTSNASHRGKILVVDKKQYPKNPCVECVIETFKAIGSVAKDGVFTPLTTMMGSIIASEVVKNLLGVPNSDTLLKIDAIKPEIIHSNVDKVKTCKICKMAKK